jgi:hypothetical protein
MGSSEVPACSALAVPTGTGRSSPPATPVASPTPVNRHPGSRTVGVTTGDPGPAESTTGERYATDFHPAGPDSPIARPPSPGPGPRQFPGCTVTVTRNA